MNSKNKGNLTEVVIMAQAVEHDVDVSQPYGDNQRYDLIFDINNKLYRVQCKTARLKDGYYKFCTSSSQNHRGRGRQSYIGQIEFFAAYCPETRQSFLVPIEDAPLNDMVLRNDPPKNNQVKGIRYAYDYLFKLRIEKLKENI